MKIRKPLALFIAVIMLISGAGCSSPVTTEGNEDSSLDTAPDTQSSEETKMLPDLPSDLTFNGEEVRIMQHPQQGGDWTDWVSRDIWAESYTGELINDAVHDRNLYVENLLNVTINAVDVADMPGAIKLQALGGTDDYHVSTARISSLSSIIEGGYLMNLYNVPHIDLEKPWYDQNCISDATLYNMLFYVTGSMILLDDDSTGAIVFNKKLISDYNLESPYSLVTNGTWTIDAFNTLSYSVNEDLDGDGARSIENDRFGILWQRDASISFLHAGGSRIVEKDTDGHLQFVLNSERTVNILDKLDTFMFNKDVVLNMHQYTYPDIYAEACKIFSENRALFMWVRMRVVENLRDMEADFGIIPVPKYSESQGDYLSTVTRYTAATIGVPNSGAIDMSLAGAVIEAMSAESHYGLREAYYDKNLGTKVVRDPESTEMLDIITQTRIYDTGEIYNIGGIAEAILNQNMQTSFNFSSFIASREKSAAKALEKFTNNMIKLTESFG